METLLGIVMAGLPLLIVGTLLVVTNRRERRRQAAVIQQIALTDAIHARLGAAVAPVVRRLGNRWQVAIAVPLEHPAVVASVLAIVDAVFAGPEPEPAAYEVVLRPQSGVAGGAPPPPGVAPHSTARVASRAPARASRAA